MFGPEYLVCPVLEEGVSEWTVYLPANEGGIYVTVPVDLEAIPVFRKV